MSEEEITPVCKKALEPHKKTPRSRRNDNIVVADGPKIVMDLQWGDLMNDHTKKKLISQCSTSYSNAKMAAKSPPLIFTSFDENWKILFDRVLASKWNDKIVQFTDKSVTEIADPKYIVYLTADTDNICKGLDPSKYYVIGCIIDHNSKKNLTRDFAVEHGIRMERLPIQEYIKMEGRKVLTVNTVAEILVRVINGEDWGNALCHSIASRKNPVVIRNVDDKKPSVKPKEDKEKVEEETQKDVKKSMCRV